jgi:hypothetical protein
MNMRKDLWIAGGTILALIGILFSAQINSAYTASLSETPTNPLETPDPLSICSQHAPKCPLNAAGFPGEEGGWQFTGKKWTWVPGTRDLNRPVVWEFSQPYQGTTPEYYGQCEDHYTLDPDDPDATYDWERWLQVGDNFKVMQLGSISESEAYLIGDTYCSTGIFYPVVDHLMPFFSTPMFTNRWGACTGGGYVAAHLYELWGEPLSQKRLNLCDNTLNGMPADLSPAGNTICKISPYVGIIFQRYIFGAKSPDEVPSVGCEAVLYAWGYSQPLAPAAEQAYQTWFRNGELRFTRWYDLSKEVTPSTIPAPDDHAWWDSHCQNAWQAEGNWLYSGVFRVGQAQYSDQAGLPETHTAQVTPAGGQVSFPEIGATLVFTSGAFTETVQLVEFIPAEEELAPNDGHFRVGPAFHLFAEQTSDAEIVQPLAPYTITLGYDPALVGSTQASLKLYGWTGREWQEEPTSQLDIANHTLTATPNHFSLWALMVEDHSLYIPQVLVEK